LKLGRHELLLLNLQELLIEELEKVNMVDVSQLVIEKDKSVDGVFADVVVLDYDGNLFDACSYSATVALITSKTP